MSFYFGEYLYAICIDFEATCWERTFSISQTTIEPDAEIIEFPAVLLNLQTCIIEAEFHTYIRPTEQPTLSKFCTDFTGITQANVEGAVPLKDGLVLFDNWLHQLYFPKGICLMDEGTRKQNTVLVTWSDYDLGVYLCDECDRKNIARPNYFDQWIDARQHYREWTGIYRSISFSMALKLVGIPFIGRPHSGIDDSRNLARLVSKMTKAGCQLAITSCV